MSNQQQINILACKIGMTTMLWSFKTIGSAFHLEPRQLSFREMSNFISNITSEQKINYVSLADSYYYTIPWATFKEILDYLKVELDKIPYTLIVGDKELESKKIAIRSLVEKDLGPQKLEDFIKKLNQEIVNKK